MIKKILVLLAVILVSLTASFSIFAQNKKRVAPAKAIPAKLIPVKVNELSASLPKSDAIVNIQISQLMKETMPQLLATKPQYIDQLNAKIDELKGKIGVDLRQFDQVAVGISYKQISATETDYAPVLLARGSFNAGGYLGIAKVAANGKYRVEKIGDKTVYIFSPKNIIAENKPKIKDSFVAKLMDRAINSFTKEVAVTSFDENTLVIGSLQRVKEALANDEHAPNDLLELAGKNQKAVLSFAAKMPVGVSSFIPLDNDELGKNISEIKQVYGFMNVEGDNGTISLTAKTDTVSSAQSLEETMNGLQMVGKAFLGGTKANDKQLYARLIEKAVISRKLKEVSLNLNVTQSDMKDLMAILLKD